MFWQTLRLNLRSNKPSQGGGGVVVCFQKTSSSSELYATWRSTLFMANKASGLICFFFWLPSYSLWHFRVGRLLLAAHTHNAVHSTLSEIHILIGGTLIGLELEVGGLGNAK